MSFLYLKNYRLFHISSSFSIASSICWKNSRMRRRLLISSTNIFRRSNFDGVAFDLSNDCLVLLNVRMTTLSIGPLSGQNFTLLSFRRNMACVFVLRRIFFEFRKLWIIYKIIIWIVFLFYFIILYSFILLLMAYYIIIELNLIFNWIIYFDLFSLLLIFRTRITRRRWLNTFNFIFFSFLI